MLSLFCNVSENPQLAAALLLTKAFPLESPCEDSAFLPSSLRNVLNTLVNNSVGSTLVTTDVASSSACQLSVGGFSSAAHAGGVLCRAVPQESGAPSCPLAHPPAPSCASGLVSAGAAARTIELTVAMGVLCHGCPHTVGLTIKAVPCPPELCSALGLENYKVSVQSGEP